MLDQSGGERFVIDQTPMVYTLCKVYKDARPISQWLQRAEFERELRDELVGRVPAGAVITRERYVWAWHNAYKAWTCMAYLYADPVIVSSEINVDGAGTP